MKKSKLTMLMLAWVTIFSMSFIVSGCGKKYQEIALYKYSENTDGTLTITGLTDKGRSEYELVVPSELDGKKVTVIGDGALRDDVIVKKVVINTGVEYIGSNAFLSCYNLEDIEIPETIMDIGTNAFTETAWKTTQFADSKEIIINNVLYEADDSRAEYDIKDGVVTIASGVFYNNTTVSKVHIPATVKNIGTYAFSGCKSLTELELPDGLESIGYGAFAKSGIKEIKIPESVKSIGQDAFLGIEKVQ